MSPPSKPVFSIRGEARSTVYRAALSAELGCAYGFLLGTTTPFSSPAIEFSLVSAIPASVDDLWYAPGRFRKELHAAQQVAAEAGLEVAGLFVAWGSSLTQEPYPHLGLANQLIGLWVDTALVMHLPYFLYFSTLAHESIWGGPICYVARGFPHDALSCRVTPGKLSIKPQHNPRRLRALWRKLLHAAESH